MNKSKTNNYLIMKKYINVKQQAGSCLNIETSQECLKTKNKGKSFSYTLGKEGTIKKSNQICKWFPGSMFGQLSSQNHIAETCYLSPEWVLQIVNDIGFSFYTRSDTTGTFTTDVDYGLDLEKMSSQDMITNTVDINSLVLKYLLSNNYKTGNWQSNSSIFGKNGGIEIEKKTELINVLFDIEHSGYVKDMSYILRIDTLEEEPEYINTINYSGIISQLTNSPGSYVPSKQYIKNYIKEFVKKKGKTKDMLLTLASEKDNRIKVKMTRKDLEKYIINSYNKYVIGDQTKEDKIQELKTGIYAGFEKEYLDEIDEDQIEDDSEYYVNDINIVLQELDNLYSTIETSTIEINNNGLDLFIIDSRRNLYYLYLSIKIDCLLRINSSKLSFYIVLAALFYVLNNFYTEAISNTTWGYIPGLNDTTHSVGTVSVEGFFNDLEYHKFRLWDSDFLNEILKEYVKGLKEKIPIVIEKLVSDVEKGLPMLVATFVLAGALGAAVGLTGHALGYFKGPPSLKSYKNPEEAVDKMIEDNQDEMQKFHEPQKVKDDEDFCKIPGNCHAPLSDGKEYPEVTLANGKTLEVGNVPRYHMPQIEADEASATKKATISVSKFANMHDWDTSTETRDISDLKMGQSEAKLGKSKFFAKVMSAGLRGEPCPTNSLNGTKPAFTNSWFHQVKGSGPNIGPHGFSTHAGKLSVSEMGKGNAIIVSQDGYAIDGNHRLSGARLVKKMGQTVPPMKVIVIKAPASEIIAAAQTTPGIRFQDMFGNQIYRVDHNGLRHSKETFMVRERDLMTMRNNLSNNARWRNIRDNEILKLARVANEFNKNPLTDKNEVDYNKLLITTGATGALLVVISNTLKNTFKYFFGEQTENLQKNTQLQYKGPISRDGKIIIQDFGIYGIIPGEVDKTMIYINTSVTELRSKNAQMAA